MEKIYVPKCYVCSEKVDFVNYFNEFAEIAGTNPTKPGTEEYDQEILRLMGVDLAPNDLETLTSICGPDKLSLPDEYTPIPHTPNLYKPLQRLYPPYPTTINATQLQSVKARKSVPELLKSDSILYRYSKGGPHNVDLNEDYVVDLTPGQDFIAYVRVYLPFDHKYIKRNAQTGPVMRFSHEICILGSQTLAQLRDKITCRNDYGIRSELAYPKIEKKIPSKKLYPSGFLFIDDVFYTDMRSSNAIDTSAVIRKWAAEKNIADFKAADMDKSCVNIITPRLGYPYVYQHLGDCEHIIIFTDARLLAPDDLLCSAYYPYLHAYTKNQTIYCTICGLTQVQWLCIESDRAPTDRAYFCHECALSYNYLKKKKIGSFKLYPYHISDI